MSKKVEMGTTEIDPKNKPSHLVYLVKNKDGKAFFEKVGAIWPHKDGKGFSQQLSFIDWNIKLLIRENK